MPQIIGNLSPRPQTVAGETTMADDYNDRMRWRENEARRCAGFDEPVSYNARVSYCLAKLAGLVDGYTVVDAAWQVFGEEIDTEQREAIEAQLEREFPTVSDWVKLLQAEAENELRARMDFASAKAAA